MILQSYADYGRQKTVKTNNFLSQRNTVIFFLRTSQGKQAHRGLPGNQASKVIGGIKGVKEIRVIQLAGHLVRRAIKETKDWPDLQAGMVRYEDIVSLVHYWRLHTVS
jgi:hypothetical protein